MILSVFSSWDLRHLVSPLSSLSVAAAFLEVSFEIYNFRKLITSIIIHKKFSLVKVHMITRNGLIIPRWQLEASLLQMKRGFVLHKDKRKKLLYIFLQISSLYCALISSLHIHIYNFKIKECYITISVKKIILKVETQKNRKFNIQDPFLCD